MKRIKYSIVVPIYNDGGLSFEFCRTIEKVFSSYLKTDEIENELEIIFVNDGSVNNSWELLLRNSGEFPFVKIISLSRNFGQHIAISAGYENASGDYIIYLNVDMEDSPEEIPGMLARMVTENIDLLVSLRIERKDSASNKITSIIFNWVLNRLTGSKAPLNLGTLRIMNRKFATVFNSLSEKSRYIPGLEQWIGFKQAYYPIAHKTREEGKSSYNFRRRLIMALDSIISFSDLPLKLIASLGFITAICGFIFLIGLVMAKFLIDFQSGYLSIICAIIFFGGIQIMFLGMASLYIGRILKETQNRPLYIINEKINF